MAIHTFQDFLREFKSTGFGNFGGMGVKRFGANPELRPAPETTSGGSGGSFLGGGGGGNIGDGGDFSDDEPEGDEGTSQPQGEPQKATPNSEPIAVENDGYSLEFEWDARLTVNVIKQHAPASAVCALIYGANYEVKTRNVQYYDTMVTDRNEPYFPFEPTGSHKLMGRKLIMLKK